MSQVSNLLKTELGWFGFGRVRIPAERIIADSALPGSHRALIANVVKRTRLRRRERAEIARELVAHFADGLEAGATEQSLVTAFGDEKRAASLIRRATRRKRGIVWHAWINFCRVFACLLLLLLGVYLYYGMRVWTAEPRISRNFLAELNAPAEAVPPEDRGWPLLREAILARTEPWSVASGEPPIDTDIHAFLEDPDSPFWTQAVRYVRENERALALTRAATLKPRLAYRPGIDDDADLQIKRGWIKAASQFVPVPENQELLSVLLPHLSDCRIFTRMLCGEAIIAAQEGRGDRVLENVTACIALADRVREFPIIINELLAISMLTLTCRTMDRMLDHSPEALTSEQWRDAAHRLASFNGGERYRIRLTGERACFHDMLQRLYTDDGRGGGLMAPSSIAHLEILKGTSLKEAWPSTGLAVRLLSPFSAAYFVDRADLSAAYERIMDSQESNFDKSLWEQPEWNDGEEELIRITSNARYMLIGVLMPALSHAHQSAERATQVRDATLTAIALELFRRERGMFPASLDELVPAFLPTVPPDRHTGRPLNYVLREGKPILYSVGVDLDDDGGAPPPEQSGAHRSTTNPVSRWKHPNVVARLQRERPDDIPDGDWILFPPSGAR